MTDKVLPDEVKDALDRIAKDDPDGIIEPRVVIEVARDPESPLHKYIYAKDAEAAAEAYYLHRARQVIARYTITRVDEGPKFVNVTVRTGTDARRGYVPTDRAVADPDLCEQIMRDARVGITAYRNRLSAFEKARGAVAALDAAINELGVQELSRAA